MRRVEIALLCVVCAAPAFAQTSTAQNYNKADTFEPGKKYNCVPTADHKGWNCNEAGKAVQIKPKEHDTPPAATAAVPTSTPPESTPPPAPSPPPSQSSSRSTLPSYLTNAAANSPPPGEEPSTVSAAAARANAPSPEPRPVRNPVAPPSKQVVTTPTKAPALTTKTVPLEPSMPKGSVAAPPPRPPAKPPLPPRVTRPPVIEAASSGGDFLSLPGDHFVVELARASSRTELDAAKSSTHVPTGDLYEVHLRQNGADSWLLLWGSFDTIEAARAARNTISASAAPGWPRRIAPLQAEARRSSP